MISLILITESKGSVELASSALRDQHEPTGSKTPPATKILEEPIELIVVSRPGEEQRAAEVTAARRLGDRADSKDAKQLAGFDLKHTESCPPSLQAAIDAASGEHIVVLPDMPYFFQPFLWRILHAHRKGFEVVVPRLKIRAPVFVGKDGRAVGKDGRERHSRLGPDSSNTVGFVLDNDCDEIVEDDHGSVHQIIACASFTRKFLADKTVVRGPYQLNRLAAAAKRIARIDEYVIHLELPWNPLLYDGSADDDRTWQLHTKEQRKLPGCINVFVDTPSWLRKVFRMA